MSENTEGAEDTAAAEESGSEAARWRRKLRDTEVERDTLTEKVQALQQRQVESLLSASGVKPAAVYSIAALTDLVGEDGMVNADKVADAVKSAQQRYGITPKSVGTFVPGVGNQPGKPPKVDGFAAAFKSPRKR